MGNRKLGMALVTVGLNVDLHTVANAYAQAVTDNAADASSSRKDLRREVLSTRAWFRWGRQLYDAVQSNRVAWESLGPAAQNAWRWYRNGWSEEECDTLTIKYGHGMLRTGSARGLFMGQQATGSVADRMRSDLL